MKTKTFRCGALLLTVCLAALLLGACGRDSGGEAVPLSFKQAAGYDYLKSINGKTVAINGYMATSSPADGSFIFLMNMPFQSCPFCVPNTTQLANTMEVYPRKGETFTYTVQAIRVTGRLVVAKDASNPFTDLYGYRFSFKIEDATYRILKDEDLSAELKLWQDLSSSGIINELYDMYNYVNFVCKWPTYKVNSYTDKDGKTVTGYYLYAADAVRYLEKDGAQFNYGYKEGYFENLQKRILKISDTAFSALVDNISSAKQLADEAVAALKNGEYTMEKKYVEEFGQEDYIYTLNRGAELAERMDALYNFFSDWLAGWEL
ncbi:MAG: hypothetical protein J5496_00265 [Lachnospiraceae bacterium]|nr:hypothetical protein [Lachnospiraceae bacterium]